MPLVKTSDFIAGTNFKESANSAASLANAGNQESVVRDPSLSETMGAAFRTENILGSYTAMSQEVADITSRGKQAGSYTPYEYLSKLGRINDAVAVSRANSDEEVDTVLEWVDRQKKDRQTIADSGWSGLVSMMAAGTVDPTMLVPGAAVLKAGKIGNNFVKAAGTGAALTAGVFAGQEALLHDSQSERTVTESALATLSGAMFGGIISGSVSALATGRTLREVGKGEKQLQVSVLHERMHDSVKAPDLHEVDDVSKLVLDETGSKPRVRVQSGEDLTNRTEFNNVLEVSNVTARLSDDGEMSIVGTSLTEEGLAYGNNKLVNSIGRISVADDNILSRPVVSGLTSASVSLRKWTNRLFNHTFELGKNLSGEASERSVQGLMQLDEVADSKLLAGLDKIYYHHIGVPDSAISDIKTLKATKLDGKMTRGEFDKELASALRNGDKHQIKSVSDAAKSVRGTLTSRYNRMKELNLIPDPVKQAKQAVDDLAEVLKKSGKEATPKQLRKQERLAKRLDKAKKDEASGITKTAESYFTRVYKVEHIAANRQKFIGVYTASLVKQGFTEKKALAEAYSVFNQVTGKEADDAVIGTLLKRLSTDGGGITKDRVSHALDNDIAEFLSDDATSVIGQYMKSSSAAIRYKEMLDEAGFSSLADMQKGIRADFSKLINAAQGNQKEVNKLLTQQKKALELSSYQAQILLGQATQKGGGDKALRNLRKFQTVVALGGVFLSSLAENGMHVFRNGIPRSLKGEMVKSIAEIKARKLEKDQISDLILGLEVESNQIINNLLDPTYGLGVAKSRIDKGFDILTTKFGKLSLITYWTNFNQRIAGLNSSANIFRSMEKLQAGKELSLSETSRLASIGIGKEDYAGITKMMKQHGNKVENSWISHFENWSDPVAKEKFMLAVQRDVQGTILLKGAKGSTPVAVQKTELGKTIFLFKTFLGLATDKILLPAAQGLVGHRQAEVTMGLTTMIGIGMMVEALKRKLSGRDIEDIDPDGSDIDDWLIAGISRSGMLGLFDIPLVGLNPALNNSRYAGSNAVSVFFGPAAGTIQNGYGALSGVYNDVANDDETSRSGIDEQTLKYMEKMTPYANLFYLKLLLDKVKDD